MKTCQIMFLDVWKKIVIFKIYQQPSEKYLDHKKIPNS